MIKHTKRTRPVLHRILSGLAAGLIIGALLGFAIAVWVIHRNSSIHTPFLQAVLKLHLAAIYSMLMLVPGLVVGLFALRRPTKVNPIDHGIIILMSLAIFYYGRNKLSLVVLTRLGSHNLLLEILGTLALAVIGWLLYRVMTAIAAQARGWLVGLCTAAVILLAATSAYNMINMPANRSASLEPPILPVPKDNVKVALIGLDGASWDIIDPLLERGRLPVFRQLINRGVRADMQTILPTDSPLIWTTIATGKMPAKHCITSFRIWIFPITNESVPMTMVPASFPELLWLERHVIRQAPINSTFRMSEAIWNMLTEAGLTVGVLNWWASYPAEPVNGYLVSDHALYNKELNVVLGVGHHHDPKAVFPPQLLADLEPLAASPNSISRDSVARFIHFQSDDDWRRYLKIEDYRLFDQDVLAAMFKFTYPEDITIIRAALYLLQNRPQPDFLAIFLDGIDSMQHKYLPYYFYTDHQDILSPDNVARFKDLVTEYYVYMDEVLGRLLAAMDSTTTVIVISDHGFDREILMPEQIYDHQNAPPGIFIMAGNNVGTNKMIEDVSVRDMTPTILAMFGLPVGHDMDGKVLTQAFETEISPITWVDTYDIRNKARGRMEPSQMDRAMLEKLRALGYFK